MDALLVVYGVFALGLLGLIVLAGWVLVLTGLYLRQRIAQLKRSEPEQD